MGCTEKRASVPSDDPSTIGKDCPGCEPSGRRIVIWEPMHQKLRATRFSVRVETSSVNSVVCTRKRDNPATIRQSADPADLPRTSYEVELKICAKWPTCRIEDPGIGSFCRLGWVLQRVICPGYDPSSRFEACHACEEPYRARGGFAHGRLQSHSRGSSANGCVRELKDLNTQ